MGELRKIPNIGRQTEKELIEMGYTSIESLKGKCAGELYAEACALHGMQIDRCQLYLYRAVEYFLHAEHPDPEKCKWWHWKDEYVEVAPCGARCVECKRFPRNCKGCRTIRGKVFWLEYTGEKCCAVYDCCVNRRRKRNCGGCEQLPCERYKMDPTISEEQHAANLRKMLDNLKNSGIAETASEKEGTEVVIRPLRPDEAGILKDFLYDAIFLPEGADPLPREAVEDPSLSIYYEGFGSQRSDRALCAETGCRIVGVVWCRNMIGFGHVKDGIPELAMAVKEPYRNQGIGTRLLHAMLADLKRSRCTGVSLSVQKANFAYGMYRKAGFRTIRETDGEYLMKMDLTGFGGME